MFGLAATGTGRQPLYLARRILDSPRIHRRALTGAHWVEPRHDGERYFEGLWDGDRGQVAHDHRSDHDRANRN